MKNLPTTTLVSLLTCGLSCLAQAEHPLEEVVVEGDEDVVATINAFDIVGGGGALAGYSLSIDDAAGTSTPSETVTIEDNDTAVASVSGTPLTITEEQIREGFAIIDRGLEITDAAFED